MLHHLDTALRVALILGASLAAMPLFRGRSASARRLVLSVAFLVALVAPFVPARVHVEAPAYHELVARVVAEPAVEGGGVADVAPAPAPARRVDWLMLAWSLGALVVIARAAVGFVRASRIAARARRSPAWDFADADVRVSNEVAVPAVAGVFSPVILVPAASADWSESRKRAVLLHELAHIGAHDLHIQALVAIVCGLHWFNPLAWLAARRLRLERELAADEAVLRAGLRASSYAEDLLAIAGHAPAGTIAIGAPPLVQRITAIVSPGRPARLGRAGAAVVVTGTAALTLGVACTNVSEPPASTAAAHVAEVQAPPAAPAPRSELQPLVTSELQRAVTKWHAAGGAILVLTPKGEVVAEAGDVDREIVVGSTMKPILLASAFEAEAVKESDVIESAPIGELLAKSNNPGFMRIFERVGSARHGRVLQGFGFAMPSSLDAKTAIGATMTATPRQVARAYASLASGGAGIVSAPTASRVTRLLEGVVASEEGTGKKARVAGVRVAGKTGTSDWTAPDATNHTYASFAGYVPAEAPRFVIYVGIESAKGENAWGSEVAAPVFGRIASRALAQP